MHAPPEQLTFADVAGLAGVSSATAPRALHNRLVVRGSTRAPRAGVHG